MTETQNKLPYGYMRSWGVLIGSSESVVQAQVQQATYERAPDDAIFRREDGEWATFEAITSGVTRADVERIGTEAGFLEHA